MIIVEDGKLSIKGEIEGREGIPTSNLENIGERIRSGLAIKHAARERALHLAREVIFNCANTIRAVHRGEFESANRLLSTAHNLLEELGDTLAEHSDLLHSGFVHDAQKEYAEAAITLALITSQPTPDPDELGVAYPAYLNGLGEAAGELRRYILDAIRRGEGRGEYERLFQMMDDIYSLLVTIDFPDAMTVGLRRTTDVVRGIMEKTRGDLTLFLKQRDLEDKMGEILKKGGLR
jgi:translin